MSRILFRPQCYSPLPSVAMSPLCGVGAFYISAMSISGSTFDFQWPPVLEIPRWTWNILGLLGPRALWGSRPQSLATNSPAPWPARRPQRVLRHEKLGNYVTWPAGGNLNVFFCSTGACTAAKSPIANYHSQINAQLYSASSIGHFRQQCHSDSEFDAL